MLEPPMPSSHPQHDPTPPKTSGAPPDAGFGALLDAAKTSTTRGRAAGSPNAPGGRDPSATPPHRAGHHEPASRALPRRRGATPHGVHVELVRLPAPPPAASPSPGATASGGRSAPTPRSGGPSGAAGQSAAERSVGQGALVGTGQGQVGHIQPTAVPTASTGSAGVAGSVSTSRSSSTAGAPPGDTPRPPLPGAADVVSRGSHGTTPTASSPDPRSTPSASGDGPAATSGVSTAGAEDSTATPGSARAPSNQGREASPPPTAATGHGYPAPTSTALPQAVSAQTPQALGSHPGTGGAADQVGHAVASYAQTLAPAIRAPGGAWRIVVRLDPPEMGSVDATLSLGPTGLHVELVASTPDATQALLSATHQLSNALGGKVTVAHPGPGSFGGTSAGDGGGAGDRGHPGSRRPGPQLSDPSPIVANPLIADPRNDGEILVRA